MVSLNMTSVTVTLTGITTHSRITIRITHWCRRMSRASNLRYEFLGTKHWLQKWCLHIYLRSLLSNENLLLRRSSKPGSSARWIAVGIKSTVVMKLAYCRNRVLPCFPTAWILVTSREVEVGIWDHTEWTFPLGKVFCLLKTIFILFNYE